MERRLAAILAADVVGYSRLMGDDEAGTLARLEGLRAEILDPLINQHHGRVIRVMGDGFLVEFASVVDALACALAWQDAVGLRADQVPEERALRFRIGVNIGDVIVKGGDVFGNGVNVAARLEGMAEPGSVLVSQTVFDHTKGKVRATFEDLGKHALKNISEPVQIFRASIEPETIGTTVAAKTPPQNRRLWAIAAAAGLLVVAVGAALWQKPWEPREEPASVDAMAFPLPDKPSIAVLPFENMSEDPNQEYFADGIAEDLITDLSKISGLFVIARNSSFSYKGQQVTVRQVAEDLGVRYVLEGSVRRVGDEVRINAQLVDATTGGHLWAERYDGSLADVFALQDKVTRQIVVALVGQLSPRDQRHAQSETDNPQAYDSFLRGWAHFQKRTPEHYGRAVKHFEKAAELDPNYGRAFAALAWIYWNGRYGGWYDALGVGPEEAKLRAEGFLKLGMAHPTPLAHQVASSMLLWRGRYDEAVAEANRAVDLDFSDADSLVALADVLIWNGTPREAIALIDRARRLDPHNEAEYAHLLGKAQFGINQFMVAVASFERALELNPDLWFAQTTCEPCVFLVSAYGYLERQRDFEEMIQKLRTQHPEYLAVINPYWWPYRKPEDFERLAAGLRKAGLPI